MVFMAANFLFLNTVMMLMSMRLMADALSPLTTFMIVIIVFAGTNTASALTNSAFWANYACTRINWNTCSALTNFTLAAFNANTRIDWHAGTVLTNTSF